MSFLTCCKSIDRQREYISELETANAALMLDLAQAHKQLDTLTVERDTLRSRMFGAERTGW